MNDLPEEEIDVPEKLQEVGQKLGEYKDALVNQFKDVKIEFRNWSFAVGKIGAEYTLEINLKLAIRPIKEN